MKKLLLFLSFSFCCFLAIWVLLNFKNLKRLPQALPAFQAKEICSCVFVENQSEEYCVELVDHWFGRGTPEIDRAKRTVTVMSNWGIIREAEWLNERLGCRLTAAKAAN